MKGVVALLVLGLAMGGTVSEKLGGVRDNPDAQGVFKIVEGVLVVLATDVGLQDLLNCLNDVETIGTDIYIAVQDFEQKTPDGIKAGLKEIGLALQIIPDAISQCQSAVTTDVQKIKNALAVFENPITLIYDIGKALVVNGSDIYDEINTAINDWHNDDWYNFGLNVGLALGKVLGTGIVITFN
jgi:hypothetical protein